MAGESAGLLSAAFIGIVPGYISRSVAGSYDNEAIAIFLLMFTFYLWIRALKEGSAFWGMVAAVFYGWMVAAWGGYVFITNSMCDDRLQVAHRRLIFAQSFHSDSSTRIRPYTDGPIQQQALPLVLVMVRHWNACVHASPLCRISPN